MDPYDSDSSLEDRKDYTETNIYLGYASKEQTEDTISHLGGFPKWLDNTRTPSATFARCKVCNTPMSLLLQLNGDLPQHFPNDDRRLHIFTCRKRQCSRKTGSFRAVREVRKHKDDIGKHTEAKEKPSSPERQKQSNDLGATLFGVTSPRPDSSNTNPFSISSQTSTKNPNPFNPLPPTSTLAAKPPQAPAEPPVETLASKLRISSPPPSFKPSTTPEPWPPEFDFPQAFPYLHLEADYETLIPEIPSPSSSKPQPEYSEEDSTFTNGLDKDIDKDLFESTLDKTFLKFSDRLAQNPEQVLRYEWKGTPLLYSSTDAVGKRLAASNARTKAGTGTAATGMPRCEACGAERVFEMQMVPGAIAALEEDDVDLNEGMEWGTVIVGVCGRNCGEVGEVAFREEWCGVQWEERG